MVGKKVLVRTYSAGVHYGTLASRKGKKSVLHNSRRIWFWAGAASISELAKHGTRQPGRCKFAVEVEEILLTETIEIIPVTAEAAANIEGVPVWSAS